MAARPTDGDLFPESLARRLADAVGPANVLTDPDVVATYTTDWTRRFTGTASAVVRPADTAQVVSAVRACAAAGLGMVVQGGNTGLVGGSVPPARVATRSDRPPPVVLSTTRLNHLGEVDRVAGQMTVGAGATLAAVQAAAGGAAMDFPVDLAARDSATIGGMIATNAGGIHVLRHGAMRRQVIGLEAVLADGQVVSRLTGLVKDNTGYDLSQLLVGSEGTLGIVTSARLRLVPHLEERAVLLLGLGSTAEAAGVVAGLRARVPSLSAAEIFYQEGLELVRAHAHLPAPFPAERPVYLLIECAARLSPLDELLGGLAGLEVAEEATAMATDPSGMARLWAYRERHTEAVSAIGVPHKLDVTVPLGELGSFVPAVTAAVENEAPGSRLILWGHVGDGNIHVNVIGPEPDDERVDQIVFELVARLGGSISAEHGIGQAKTAWLGLSRSPAEVKVMRAIKGALDPQGLFNPGVLLP